MASLAQLEAALVKADAAGDVDAARVFAGEIRKLRAMPQQETKPFTPSGEKSAGGDVLDQALNLLRGANQAASLHPAFIPAKAMQIGGEMLEKGAYEAGGMVTDATKSPELGAAANFLTQAAPALIGGGTGRAVEPAMRGTARFLMQSALKPSAKDMATGRAAKAVDTMLSEGANVSEAGVAKLQGQVDVLRKQIDEALAMANEYGPTVDRGAVAARIQDAVKKFEKQVNPTADLKAIEAAGTEFIGSQPAQIGARQAQELKQGTYNVLRGKYGEQGSAAVEAQKALARGLKEEIERVAPEVRTLNARESELINALVIADRRAMMEGNKNPAGLGFLANNPAAAGAFLGDRSAAFKSAVARLINARARDPQAVGAATGAYIGAATGESP